MNRTILNAALIALLASITGNTRAADLPSTNLLGYWKFEEATGMQVRDSSSRGHHGTMRGAIRVPGGKFGTAVACNRDALVEIPHVAAFDQMPSGLTVSAWVNRQTNDTWNMIISREVKDGTSEYFGLAVVKNKALFSVDPDGAHYQNIKGDTDMPVGEWIHLAGTYDNAQFKLYVNGRLLKSSPCTVPFRFQDQNPIIIGGNSNSKGLTWVDCFHGQIDEVRLFSRSLSEKEVQTLSHAVPGNKQSMKSLSPNGNQSANN